MGSMIAGRLLCSDFGTGKYRRERVIEKWQANDDGVNGVKVKLKMERTGVCLCWDYNDSTVGL